MPLVSTGTLPEFCGGYSEKGSLRKQLTFGDATTGFPAKWSLRNERRNSILMTRHFPELGSVSDWLNQISHAARPIRSTTQIWVVTRHQYGFLHSFLRRHLAGKPLVASPNVGCFLRLEERTFSHYTVLVLELLYQGIKCKWSHEIFINYK